MMVLTVKHRSKYIFIKSGSVKFNGRNVNTYDVYKIGIDEVSETSESIHGQEQKITKVTASTNTVDAMELKAAVRNVLNDPANS